MRPVSAEGFAPPAAVDAGPAPVLQWIRIADLTVDPGYQRDIGRAGRRNVAAIAAGFTWSKFGAVVVAPIEGGRYAIVDGQHRTTAALVCGFDSVPCQIIIADRRAQAAAFEAINGQATPVTALALHKARRAAGDPEALAVDAACAAADARILTAPRPSEAMKVGDSTAVMTIAKALKVYGHGHVVTAMQCVTRTADGNPGLLVATVIKGFCLALERQSRWRESGAALLDALDSFDVGEAFDAAHSATARRTGLKPTEAFALAVERHLAGREAKAA
jgi:hypothetical protein